MNNEDDEDEEELTSEGLEEAVVSEDEVTDAINKMVEANSDDIAKSTQVVLDNILKNGMVPQDALGITDNTADRLYGEAYRLYNSGKYVDASRIFRLLIMLNVTDPKYTLGLAGCFHMLKEYTNALKTYTHCSLLDPDSPIPYYHMSDCSIKSNDPLSAIVSLELAVQRSGDRPEYSVLKERALLTIEQVKKTIGINI